MKSWRNEDTRLYKTLYEQGQGCIAQLKKEKQSLVEELARVRAMACQEKATLNSTLKWSHDDHTYFENEKKAWDVKHAELQAKLDELNFVNESYVMGLAQQKATVMSLRIKVCFILNTSSGKRIILNHI